MKISNTNNLAASYRDISLHTKDSPGSYTQVSDGKSFDAVSIQSTPRQITEKKFASSLAGEIVSQVSRPVSPERLEQLKDQIASGSYRVNASAVASGMLLIQEES